MHEQPQESDNRGSAQLTVGAYWIDADGMKLGLAAARMGWIRLLLIFWLIPVGLGLLLWGQIPLSACASLHSHSTLSRKLMC
jgi:hypothetical protein